MKVVAVSGNFDPLHSGHVSYLQEAKKLGDKVIVILTRDDQVIMKKGYCFMTYRERKKIVEAITGKGTVAENVDKDITSCESLRKYKPSIFAKGGDTWDINNLPERAVCEELGIKVVFGVGGFHKEQSSSDLIRRAVEGHRSSAKQK